MKFTRSQSIFYRTYTEICQANVKCTLWIFSLNKTVLLRERKRPTARLVARGGGTYLGRGYLPWVPSVLTWPGGTYLCHRVPTLGHPMSWPVQGYPPWGTPILTWPGGTYLGVSPHPDLPGGTYLGVPHVLTCPGYVPWGTHVLTWPGEYLPWPG